jgi:hypothetical protein
MGMCGFDNLDSRHSINLTSLRKWGALEPGWRSYTIRWTRDGMERGKVSYETRIAVQDKTDMVRLQYTATDKSGCSREMDYEVPLTSISCGYGGRKWFFKCPGCYRRCRILYEHGAHFVCRKCTGLWYDSQTYITNRFRTVQNLFDADKLEETLTRRYYRGVPTRKYRRILKLQHGMDTFQRLQAQLAITRDIGR